MRPIVLATDGSASAAAAVEQAVELAAESQATLLVVTVWDSPYTGLGYAPLPAVVDVNAEMVERAPQIVEDVALRARAAGVDVETVVRRGFPVDEVCRVAKERNARVIVIGSHHWGRVRRALHGSVSQGVVQSAHCPVIVVPAAPVSAAQSKKSDDRWVPAARTDGPAGKPHRRSARSPMAALDARARLGAKR
jgi:nucleotide-binding universal stress UspA family protein